MHIVEKLFVNSKFDYLFHKWFGVNKLLKHIELDGSNRILELGCGIGMTAEFINIKFSESSIIALDYDESQIKIAKEKNHNERVKFVQGDATNLKFQNQSFDTVFEILAFHHIPEFRRAIHETNRVLKVGGRFILMDIAGKLLNPFSRFFSIFQGEFTKKDFIKALKDNGFAIEMSKRNLLFSIVARKIREI